MVNPLTCFITVVTLLLAHAPAASPDEPGEPQIHRPVAGEYQHLWLNFEGGGGAAKVSFGMRAGRSTTAWFLNGEVPGGVKATDAYRVLLDAHDLSISGDSLRGKIVLRQVSVWQPKHLAEVTLSIDATKAGGDFTGTWTGEVTGGKKTSGACRGSLADEAAIRAAQSFAPDAGWPGYHGPHAANCAAGDGRPLVEDLSQARPVWRAEQPLLSGWGTGVDARYTWRAAVGTVCGGAGTPVVARGRVYLFHYTPAGEPDAKVLEKVLADFTAQSKRDPLPAERASLVDYSRPFADTVVTCLDAGTGALQWRTTFPRWAGNVQTHKWRGLNPTAAVVGTVVIASDYSQNWVALDAGNGDVLWTLKRSRKIAGRLLGKRAFDEKTAPVGSNQWLALIGNRLLLAPEGQHGSLSLELLDATPGLESRGRRWSPPNNSTTAYAVHALGFPVADGRLFVRGMDGLYCYDLRAAGR